MVGNIGNERELRRESSDYLRLLSLIRNLIDYLINPRDAELCLLWLEKLDDSLPAERPLRNELLALLLENVRRKRLGPPFSSRPPEGPLSGLQYQKPKVVNAAPPDINVSVRLQKVYSNEHLNSPLTGYDDNYGYYERPSEKLRLSESPSSVNQRGNKSVEESSSVNRPGTSSTLNANSVNLWRKAQLLENQNKVLERKCFEFEDALKKERMARASNEQIKIKASQTINHLQTKLREYEMYYNQLILHFKCELQEVIARKNETIATLENEMRSAHADTTIMLGEQEKSMLERCEKLESEYKKILAETAQSSVNQRKDEYKKLNEMVIREICNCSGRTDEPLTDKKPPPKLC